MKTSNTKRVRAWAVIESGRIDKSPAYRYRFELKNGIPEQEVATIFLSADEARKWMKKWITISGHDIVPCTITYSLPHKKQKK